MGKITINGIQYRLVEINSIPGKKYGRNILRRDEGIDETMFCTGLWQNLFNMGRFHNSVPCLIIKRI
jgi:hypothetical protein